MTEKELRKLKRGDFLQLLLAQSKDMTALQTRLDETTVALEQSRAANERLKSDLAEKNTLIEKFKGRLNTKDATIDALRQEIADLMAGRAVEQATERAAGHPLPPRIQAQKKQPPQPVKPASLKTRIMKAVKPALLPERLTKPFKK